MASSARPRMLCREGYDSPAILDPCAAREPVELQAQTLLSDAAIAARLVDGESRCWDILNINSAHVRDFLQPRGMIRTLDRDRFAHYEQGIYPPYPELLPWSCGNDGELIGLGQRFGPFNLVVNTGAIGRADARDQGFELANDARHRKRFGILDYPDFNVFHFCIGAGLNPFAELGPDELARFEQTAHNWYRDAGRVDDNHHRLNRALIENEIDFYVSGGVYTASPARLGGHLEIEAITPRRGPIDGKGGIVFTEITSILNHPGPVGVAENFLLYLLEPGTAIASLLPEARLRICRDARVWHRRLPRAAASARTLAAGKSLIRISFPNRKRASIRFILCFPCRSSAMRRHFNQVRT